MPTFYPQTCVHYLSCGHFHPQVMMKGPSSISKNHRRRPPPEGYDQSSLLSGRPTRRRERLPYDGHRVATTASVASWSCGHLQSDGSPGSANAGCSSSCINVRNVPGAEIWHRTDPGLPFAEPRNAPNHSWTVLGSTAQTARLGARHILDSVCITRRDFPGQLAKQVKCPRAFLLLPLSLLSSSMAR
jgi:hypothetical protein